MCCFREFLRICKVFVIGVYGFFLYIYFWFMIGYFIGILLWFVILGVEVIRKWVDEYGCVDCEIEKVVLEGEGKISDCVDNFWKLMLNWIDYIWKVDLIIIVCYF